MRHRSCHRPHPALLHTLGPWHRVCCSIGGQKQDSEGEWVAMVGRQQLLRLENSPLTYLTCKICLDDVGCQFFAEPSATKDVLLTGLETWVAGLCHETNRSRHLVETTHSGQIPVQRKMPRSSEAAAFCSNTCVWTSWQPQPTAAHWKMMTNPTADAATGKLSPMFWGDILNSSWLFETLTYQSKWVLVGLPPPWRCYQLLSAAISSNPNGPMVLCCICGVVSSADLSRLCMIFLSPKSWMLGVCDQTKKIWINDMYWYVPYGYD